MIVLLILAAVTINALNGDNGILKREKDAKEQTNEKNQEEMGKLDNYKSTIDQYADGTDGGSNTNFTNIDTAKSNPPGAVPAGSTVIGPDANKGIVIKDKNNNEWVWIEVPKDTAFSGLTIDTTGTITEQNYTDIKNKMISYAQTYWGNYKNTSRTITSENAKQSTDYGYSWEVITGTKPTSSIILSTGASEETKK